MSNPHNVDLRKQLDALATDSVGLRNDLDRLLDRLQANERAAVDAVRRGDDASARHHLDAMESHRTEAGIIEAELRVITATVDSYRDALEALGRGEARPTE